MCVDYLVNERKENTKHSTPCVALTIFLEWVKNRIKMAKENLIPVLKLSTPKRNNETDDKGHPGRKGPTLQPWEKTYRTD